jgi:prepilin-type N-terminal cleavage/methylation domain-containing protein
MNTAARQHAFTIVELVLVLAIIAVLSAIAMPRYSSSIQNFRAAAAARRIAADISMARTQARAASASRTIAFDTALLQYTVSGALAIDSTGVYTVRLNEPPYRCPGLTVMLTSGPNLTFNGYGVPSGGGTITVSAGRAARTISVNAGTGEVGIN